MRVALVVAVVAASFPTTAAAAELTPDGPATLLNRFTGPSTLEGRPPEVLTAVRVVVGDGGHGGTIRVRAGYEGVPATTAVGDPVELPAAAGTYMFPAPHIRWDYRGGRIGIDQTTGGHALVEQRACDPSAGQFADPCKLYLLDSFAGDPPPGAAGTPSESREGASLALTGVFERDQDKDLRGDVTEDRTDLQVSAVPTRDADGRWRIPVTVRNAGPLPADLPVLKAAGIPSRWQGGGPELALAPIAVGETRTATLIADSPTGVGPFITVSSEGPDLAPGDNTTTFIAGTPPAFTLATAKRHSLRKGIRVDVLGLRAGRARVTAAFKVRGRTVRVSRTVKLSPYTKRSVTLRASGAKLRSLKRALKQGPLSAEITVRTFSGKTPVSAKSTVTR